MQTGDIDAIKKYAYLEAIFSSLTFFCINDTGDNLPSDDVSLRKVSEVLDKLLGEPIEWERG